MPPVSAYVPSAPRSAWTANLKDMKTSYSSFEADAETAWPFCPESRLYSWWAWMVKMNAVANRTYQCVKPFPNDSDLPEPSYVTITNLGANNFRWNWDGALATAAYWFAIGVKATLPGHHRFGSVGNTFKFWSAQLKTATRLAPQIVGCHTFHWFINKTTGQFSRFVYLYPPY